MWAHQPDSNPITRDDAESAVKIGLRLDQRQCKRGGILDLKVHHGGP